MYKKYNLQYNWMHNIIHVNKNICYEIWE